MRFDSCMPQDDPHTHLKLTAYPLICAGRRCRATNLRAEIRPTSICHRFCRRGCPMTLLHQPYTLRLNPLLHRLARPACPGTCDALLVPPWLRKAALAPHPCATTASLRVLCVESGRNARPPFRARPLWPRRLCGQPVTSRTGPTSAWLAVRPAFPCFRASFA